jgi:hypothetical protein
LSADYHPTPPPRGRQAERAQLQLRDALRGFTNEPLHIVPFLQLGRLAQIRPPLPKEREGGEAEGGEGEGGGGAAAEAPLDWGWGVIVNFKDLKEGSERKRKGKRDGEAGGAVADYTVDVLLRCAPGAEAAIAAGRLPEPSVADDCELHVLTLPLAHVDRLSSVKLQMPSDLRPADA